MIEIIPIKKDDLFESGLTNKQIKSLTINNYCYSVDITLLTKILSIENRPIQSQKIFVKNILNFLVYLDSSPIIENKEGNIDYDIFERYFTSKHYNVYKDILSDLDIITKIPHENGTWYSKGQYSLKYKVHNKYLNTNDLCLVIIDEGRKKYERTITIDDRLNLNKRFINTIDKVDLNVVNAIEAEIKHCNLNNLPLNNLRSRLNRIFYLKQRRFINKGNKVERVYHSFTNLSKVSRKHLSIRFNYIDIKNSQPLILTYYLISNNMDIDSNYKKDCEDGLIYENFYDLYKDIKSIEEVRTKVKQQIYKNIFFGFNKRSIVNKRFGELYPKTWLSLNDISQTDISLASRLQNLESELFNNLVPKKSKYYFTLFDAIYFSDTTDIIQIRKEIDKFFKNLGVKVKIEIG